MSETGKFLGSVNVIKSFGLLKSPTVVQRHCCNLGSETKNVLPHNQKQVGNCVSLEHFRTNSSLIVVNLIFIAGQQPTNSPRTRYECTTKNKFNFRLPSGKNKNEFFLALDVCVCLSQHLASEQRCVIGLQSKLGGLQGQNGSKHRCSKPVKAANKIQA